MYAKFFEKLAFLTPLIRTRKCAYPGVRNIIFSENFPYVLNRWLHRCYTLTHVRLLFPSYITLKSDNLMFSGGIESEHWPKMSWTAYDISDANFAHLVGNNEISSLGCKLINLWSLFLAHERTKTDNVFSHNCIPLIPRWLL